MNGPELLDALWSRYAAEVPYAATFVRLSGGTFRNDHVAFRGLAGRTGIDVFAPVFEALGWKRAGAYEFPDAHLSAIHLSHPDGLPRVFLSELHADRLAGDAREILERSVEPPPPATGDLVAWFAAPRGGVHPVDLEIVDRASQYGAWLLCFGRKVNHFTASVDDVEAWQAKLLAAGVPMKQEIEGARGGPLRQTATAAAKVLVKRADRKELLEWPYAYFEIAQRAPGFDGFLTPQARNLFDMTKRS